MKVMVILTVIGALCTVTERLLQGLGDLEKRERIETISNIIKDDT